MTFFWQAFLVVFLGGVFADPRILTAAPQSAAGDRLSTLEQKIAGLKETQKKIADQHALLQKEIASLKIWIRRNAG